MREIWPVAGLWIDSDAPPVKPVRETGTQMIVATKRYGWLGLSVGACLLVVTPDAMMSVDRICPLCL